MGSQLIFQCGLAKIKTGNAPDEHNIFKHFAYPCL